MAVLPKDHLNHILMYGSITKGSSYVWQYYQRIILIISLYMSVLPKDYFNHILMYGSITKGTSQSYTKGSLYMSVLPKDYLNHHILMYTKGSS